MCGEGAALQRSARSKRFSNLCLPPLIMRHGNIVHIYLDIQTISVTPALPIRHTLVTIKHTAMVA